MITREQVLAVSSPSLAVLLGSLAWWALDRRREIAAAVVRRLPL